MSDDNLGKKLAAGCAVISPAGEYSTLASMVFSRTNISADALVETQAGCSNRDLPQQW